MQAAPEGLALETEMIPPTPATQDREDRGPHKERGDERRKREEEKRGGKEKGEEERKATRRIRRRDVTSV